MSKLSTFSFLVILLSYETALAQSNFFSNDENGKYKVDDIGNEYGLEVQNITASTLKDKINDRICQNIPISIEINYPIGTENKLLDEIFYIEALIELNAQKKIDSNFIDPADCPPIGDEYQVSGEFVRNFRIQSASSNYLSVVYADFYYSPMAAHPNTSFKVVNYNFNTGREMITYDLFPISDSLLKIWPKIVESWCKYNDYHKLPEFYEFPDDFDGCANPQATPLPDSLKGRSPRLEALGNPYFTPDGMTLILGPYDGWSYADGPSSLSIPKDELIALGASPAIWGD
jgi:hypothetical protein